MRIAIAGGSGFLGRHVAAELRARGHEPVVLARGTRAPVEGARLVECDAARGVPAAALRGCRAVVNLIGIKRESPGQDFEAVHVGATRHLLEACRAADVERFVHVSVVCSRQDSTSGYHDTKWRAEQLVRGSGLAFTILRPGVIYGPGDDMLTHLVRMLRFAPLFPVVGEGGSLLQPVDVRDVAAAVAEAVERPASAGQSFDVVGPVRMPLREVVETVAEGARLPVQILPTPVAVQRLAVRAMNALSDAPLSTPAQLQMLIDGLYGDPEPARRVLGIEPRAFTPEAVAELDSSIGPLFGFSLRLRDGRGHDAWLARFRPFLGGAIALAVLAPVLNLLLGVAIANVWYRMAAAGILLTALALRLVRLDWRALFRPSAWNLVAGIAAALAMYAGGWAVVQALLRWPAAAAQVAALYAWKDAVPAVLSIPLLLLIVTAEELVWRAAVTLPLAARFGPWRGALAAAAAFAVAHLPMGIPVLLVAALAAGAAWSAMVLKARNGVPALVSHLLWDAAVLFWAPYLR